MTSERTAARLTRILAMLPWVLANPGVHVAEVMDRFGYTAKELADDLNVVFVCGLPGYGPGDLMDAYIDDDEVVVDMADYFSASPRLTSAEGLTLLASGMALLSAGLASDALERGVGKLLAALLPEGGEAALAVDLPREPETVPRLRTAAVEGRVVHITYTGLASGATTERSVEPWNVFSALGNWYLRGHCRLAGAERVFRVDRIRSIEDLDEHFPPAAPSAPVIEYTPGVDDVHSIIKLAPGASWVADYYPVDVLDSGEEGLTVRFSASSALIAARLLVRLGAAAELIEGDEVAAAVVDLRQRIMTRYGASAH